MKASNNFQTKIQNHLNEVAKNDPLFAKTLKKKNKNIEGCCNYIASEVQKAKIAMWDDDEIYAMAVHYYDEDSIKDVKAPKNYKVVHTESKGSKPLEKSKPVSRKPIKKSQSKPVVNNQTSLF